MRAYFLVTIVLLGRMTAFADDNLVRTHKAITVATVTASSAFSEIHSVGRITDSSGMADDRHDNEGNARTMWHSVIDPPSSRAAEDTPAGPAWVRFDFQKPEVVTEIRIWNHNQHGLTDRGLKKVYLSVSDGETNWRKLKVDKKEYVVVPRASGAAREPASISIRVDSAPIKHLVITADDKEGNYGGNVYGLSEVRFYSSRKMKRSDLPMPSDMEITVGKAFLYRNDGKAGREASIALKGGKLYGAATMNITSGEISETTQIAAVPTGRDSISLALPPGIGVSKKQAVRFQIRTGQQVLEKTIDIAPRRQWTVYIYPHSHVDIGYTAPQDIVKKLHMRNIDVGIDIGRKTADFPRGSRYVWNPEVNWAVDGYLKQADAKKKKEFAKAVKDGIICLNATYGNQNTSASSDEEILRLFSYTHYLRKLTGAPIDTMVQFDIPGASWGTVQAAAQNGVRGFFLFPNHFDRIGTARITWDQKAFYWIANDGKTRIFFMQGWPYGYGYTMKGRRVYGIHKIQTYTDALDRLSTPDPTKNFIDPFIFQETLRLERANHPYDIFVMTWAMADNALIDADLPHAVKAWNEKYAYPKLIIAGTHEIMTEFEKRYADIIPEVRGDYTEYWTDGLGSDARRVGLNRCAKERLVQAETLWCMLNQDKPAPTEEFYAAWRWVMLGSEHTWGYHSPAAPQAKAIEATKASYFENADRDSRALLKKAVQPILQEDGDKVAVFNTLSWNRGGLVTLSAEQSKAGDRVVDGRGKPVLSQRLSTCELAFIIPDVPALSSRLYRITTGQPHAADGCRIDGNTIKNRLVKVTVDQATGNIVSLVGMKSGHNFVDATSKLGMNSYQYLNQGRGGGLSSATDVVVKTGENGPLVSSFVITSKGTGCKSVTREIRVIAGQPHVELINTLDKISTRTKEGVHFPFPFNVPGGTVRMDIPWGIMTPEEDQLPGGNRNWLAYQRWIDVSNDQRGITWVGIESPLVQMGSITANILGQGRGWLSKLPETQTLISWALNNHWHTNFPLQQGGIIKFRYAMLPHGGAFDGPAANRFGMEQHRPLVAVSTDKNPVSKPFISIDNANVAISTLKPSRDGKAVILRLRSLSDKEETVKLSWPESKPEAVRLCNAEERPSEPMKSELTLLPYGVQSLRIQFQDSF